MKSLKNPETSYKILSNPLTKSYKVLKNPLKILKNPIKSSGSFMAFELTMASISPSTARRPLVNASFADSRLKHSRRRLA